MSELQWLKYEVIVHWAAVACYAVSTFFFAVYVVFNKPNALRNAIRTCAVGLVPHSAALLVRWIEQGHGPYMTRYEVLSSDAWITIVLFLAFSWRWKKLRPAGLVVLPIAFFMIAVAMFTNPQMQNLPPSLRSFWLVLHVGFAKLAAGSIIISLGAAILYLLNGAARVYQKLPSPEVLDAYSFKFAGFGFIFWTINIVAGAIWADVSWGRYWGWDPIETWSLITWLMYGTFAHIRLFWKWRGEKSAYFLIACFLMSIFTIFILPFVAKSLHSEYFVP
jgi:cytochrome c-type biogenesis protein CcsB